MPLFEELDFQPTPIGDISLRRRAEPRLGGREVYEIKLGDEFLMSSLFTAGEEALATRALERLDGRELEVVVGGLGLGHTAHAALASARVTEVLVIEYLAAVIDWHRRALVPLGRAVSTDARCRLVAGDFFALAGDSTGFDHDRPARRFDAVLLDIDHSPRHTLTAATSRFYSPAGLAALAAQIKPGGLFAMWSNDPPDAAFIDTLGAAFARVDSDVVTFDNPYSGGSASCTLYFAAPG